MSVITPNNILITEDDRDTRDFLEFLLTDAGYQVTASSNIEEALRLARSKEFDLYLLDNWLHGSSGVELCQKLREFDVNTPVLFCSGATGERERQKALDGGAQVYLIKPVDTELLLAEVSRLIAESRKPTAELQLQR